MTQVYINNTASSLVASVTMATTDLSITIGDGVLFPTLTGGDFFLATLHDKYYTRWEVVKVTGKSGDTLIAARGYEGTQQAWSSGTYLTVNVTAKTLADLTEGVESAAAAAVTAQATADDALAAVDDVVTGVVARQGWTFSITGQADGDYDKGQYSVIDLIDEVTGSDYYLQPLPFFGGLPGDWHQVVIHRNGLLIQNALQSDYIASAGEYDVGMGASYYQILGPVQFRIWPPLEDDELIHVEAPVAPWHDLLVPTTYPELYSVSGVEHSYRAGGREYDDNVTVDTTLQYSWHTHTSVILATSYDITETLRHGCGAATNEIGTCWFFGGGDAGVGATNKTHKLPWNPLSSMVTGGAFAVDTTYGCTFSDQDDAWVCGVGDQSTDLDIYKYDLALDTSADLGIDIDSTQFLNATSICNQTTGWIFFEYSGAGSNALGQYHKLTCATDALAVAAAMGQKCNDTSAAVLFSDDVAFIWLDGGGTSSALLFDITTDTDTVLNYAAVFNPEGDGSNDVACDGEYWAICSENTMLRYDTKAITVNYPSHRTGHSSWIERRYQSIGTVTDMWGRC